MYWCDLSNCIDPKTKKSQCYKQPSGKKCEHSIFGCPQCHSPKIRQMIRGSFSFLICEDCEYEEFDD